MKISFLIILLALSSGLSAQNYIKTANDCYDEKKYKCVIENYQKALDAKTYQEKDYITIITRIGYAQMQEKNFREAARLFTESVKAKPDNNAYSWWNLGASQYSLGSYAEAIASYEKAKPGYANNAVNLSSIWFEQARAMYYAGDYENAWKNYQQSYKLDSTNIDAATGLAASAYSLGKYEDAIAYYDLVISRGTGPEDAGFLSDMYFWKGKSQSALSQNEKALGSYEMAISLDSTHDNAYALAGDAAIALKYYTTGVKYYTRAIELGNTDKGAMAARYYMRGKAHNNLKDYSAALADLNKALELKPDYLSPHWDIAAVWYNQEKYKQALEAYTKCLGLYKDTASLRSLYYWRGETYRAIKDYKNAAKDYNMSLKLDPGYGAAAWAIATVTKEEQRYKDAIPMYTRAIDMYKENKSSLDDLQYWRGFCYLRLKDTANAIEDFKKALQVNSNLVDPNMEMGHIHFARKEFYSANTYYNKSFSAIKDSSRLALIWLRKGISNLRTNNTYSATSDLKNSIRYDSLNPAAHRYLGEANYMSKYFNTAVTDFTRCISLYKNNKDSLPVMYAYRAQVYAQLKKYAEALADYEQAAKLQPKEKNHLAEAGKYAFELKQYAKVKDIYTKLIAAYKPAEKTELAFAYYAKGRAAYELNEKQQAVADFTKALEYYPEYAEAKQWLNTAKGSAN